MRKFVILIVLAAVAGVAGWYYYRTSAVPEAFALYGNIEFYQADLAFNSSQRISEVLVEEGDRVVTGQVLARLDDSHIRPQIDQAKAQIAYNQAVVDELKRGSRPEEIAQAQANLVAAQTEAANLKAQYDRSVQLKQSQTVSQQTLDQAKAGAEIAAAKTIASQRTLDLLVAGPRKEKIDQAEAQLAGSRAALGLLEQQLADTELKSPSDGVIRSRLMEPGEIAAPTRAVLSLARPDRKWVRTYVSENQLGLVREGLAARITVDSFPGRSFAGTIGFISPVAEFTPKAVQTQELRSSLVYEVRVLTEDRENLLRLGMPATVSLAAETGNGEAGEGARP